MKRLRTVSIILAIAVLALTWVAAIAQDEATEEPEMEMTEEEALIAHGEYIAYISGCISCHTPPQEEYRDLTALTLDQAITMSIAAEDTLDIENAAYSGGRIFDLGPAGIIFTANITPDEETGIGSWTDEEIETAIRIGVNPDGRRLFPLMPYRNYFNMAEDDMQALIAFLRSLEPVENEVPRIGPTGEGIAPELIAEDDALLEAPVAADDPVARGEYLVNTIMSCGDCHTPIDPTTGEPIFDQWLAGGQPWEGPWGIVYGGNITPHEETGIGTWTDEEIAIAIRAGIRPDGRRLILMPWQDYIVLTDEDTESIVAYLRDIPAVDLEAPAPSIGEPFLVFEDAD